MSSSDQDNHDNQNSKPKWTPGPWKLSYAGDYDRGYGWDVTPVNGGYQWISSVNHNHSVNNKNPGFPRDEVAQANANLIAAAPELAEEHETDLERLATIGEAIANGNLTAAIELITRMGTIKHSLLAKARGEK